MKTTQELIEKIECPNLRSVCRQLLRDPEFLQWPAAMSHHHNYSGGLHAHTVEVANYALNMARDFSDADLDVLLTACLWHDAAKTLEYEEKLFRPDATPPEDGLRMGVEGQSVVYWVKSSYLKQVGHVSGSAMMFWAAAKQQGNILFETQQAVVHAILAHHGRSGWGSPVEPQTVEALILHQADMLSAKYGATKAR